MRTPLRRAIALSGLTAVVVVTGSIAVADGPAVEDITARALSSAPEATDLTSEADTADEAPDNPDAVRGLDAETLERLRTAGDIESAPAPRPRSTPDRGDRTAQDPEASAEPPASTESTGAGYIGYASWYGPGFHGNTTASGEVYDQYAMTAAHKTLPFGTELRVTNTANGRSVVVRINDRGPFVDGRDLDLSRAAAEALGFDGVARVRIERLS